MSDMDRVTYDEFSVRLVKAEWELEIHNKELSSLRDTSKELTQALTNINTVLHQIKWFAVGSIVVLLADSTGVLPVIKRVILGG